MTSNDLPQFPRTQDPDALRRYDADLRARREEFEGIARFRLAAQENPDVRAEALDIAGKLGIEPDLAFSNIEVARATWAERQARSERLRELAPQLFESLRTSQFAEVAHDDVKALYETAGFLTRFGRGFDVGVGANRRGALGAKQLAFGLTREEEIELAGLNIQASRGWDDGFLGAVSSGFGQLLDAVPSTLAGAGAGALAGPGGATIGAASALYAHSATVGGGNLYLDLVQSGVDPRLARELAIAGGLLIGGLELTGAKVAAAPFRSAAAKFAGKFARSEGLQQATTGAATRSFLREYASAIGAETGTEVLQEVVGIAAEALGRRPDQEGPSLGENLDRIIDVAAKTAMAMSVLATPGPVLHYYSELQRASDTKDQAQFFAGLAKGAEESKLRKRAPSIYEAYIAKEAAGTQAETVFVDAKMVAQALQQLDSDETAGPSASSELEQILPGILERIAKAAREGGDVTIPTAQVASRLVGTKFHDALLPHMRLREGGKSAAEAEQTFAEREAMAKEAQRQLEQNVETTNQLVTEAREVEQQVLAELRATRRLPDDQARASAVAYRNLAVRAAAHAGIPVKQWHEQHGLRFATQAPGAAEATLSQDIDTPEFRTWFGESKVRDVEGKPLVVYHGSTESFDVFEAGEFGFHLGDEAAADMMGDARPVYLSLQNPLRMPDLGVWEPGKVLSTAHVRAKLPTAEVAAARAEVEQLGQELAERLDSDDPIEARRAHYEWSRPVRELLQRHGYDGFVYKNEAEGFADSYVAFESTQIKSVNNRGTFDPNVLRQDTTPIDFYSALQREVAALNVKGTGADGWKQALQGLVNKGKVKQEEIEWSGVLDWLDLQQGKIAKEKLVEFLQANGVRVETVTLGGKADIAQKQLEEAKRALIAHLEKIEKFPASLANDFAILVQQTSDDSGTRLLFEDYRVPGGEGDLDAVLELASKLRIAYRARNEIGTESRTKFGSYTLPGGTNYREVLLTLPQQLLREAGAYDFRSSHFDAPNIVAHLRLNDRTDAQGRRVLFVEEIQSDWAQQGRKEGFALRSKDTTPMDAEYRRLVRKNADARAEGREPDPADVARARELEEALIRSDKSKIPVAPFVETTKGWLNLALKKVLMLAVEGGYAAVAIINGEQSAERYDLSKQVDRIIVGPPERTLHRTVQIELSNRDTIELGIDEKGEVIEGDVARGAEDFVGKPLDDVVGKEMAERILQAPVGGWEIVRAEEVREFDPDTMDPASWVIVSPNGDVSYTLRTSAIDSEYVEQVLTFDSKDEAQSYLLSEIDPEAGKVVLEGEDLRVGGTGMKEFYDSIVPKALAALTKKLGGEMGRTGINTDPAEGKSRVQGTSTGLRRVSREEAMQRHRAGEEILRGRPAEAGTNYQPMRAGGTDSLFTLFPDAEFWIRDAEAKQEGAQVALAVDDKLRASVAGGLSLFSPNARGEFFPEFRTAVLYEKADISTVMHEMAHFFLESYSALIEQPNAAPQLVQDMQTVFDWFGVTREQWAGMSIKQRERYHEQFAYNFEIYLHGGDAPSVEMRTVFQRFAAWLRAVYSDIVSTLNRVYRENYGTDLPMLTPEVRSVFDRLFASEAAIAEYESLRGLSPIFQSQAESGLDDQQWAELQARLNESREAASLELARRSLSQMQWLSRARAKVQREMQAKHDRVRARVRDEVGPEVAQQPVHRLRHWLKTGRLPDAQGDADTNHRLQRESVQAIALGGRDLAPIDHLLSKGGIPADIAAEMFGFESTADMVTQLLDAPPLAEAIDAATDQRMLEEHSDLVDPKAVEVAVSAALHNEARARFVAAELAALTRATQPVRALVATAKAVAEDGLEASTLRDLSPKKHEAAEARAAKAAREAMRKGDTEGAATAARQQLLQNQFVVIAMRAQEEVRKALRSFKRFAQPDSKLAKKRSLPHIAAGRALLAMYGLGTEKQAKDAAVLLQQLQDYSPEDYAQISDVLKQHALGAKNYRDLSLGDFRMLKATLDALWFKAKRDKQIRIGDDLQALDAAVQPMADRMEEIGVPAEVPGEASAADTRGIVMRAINSTKAWLRRVEHWATAMDGEAGPGAFTKVLVRPVQAALTRYRTRRNEFIARYVKLLQAVPLTHGKIEAPELGYTFGGGNGGLGIAELLGALLHTGNRSNKNKMLGAGRGPNHPWGAVDLETGEVDDSRWTKFFRRAVREGIITDQHLDFVQSVWDLLEEIKPDLQKAHYEIEGRFFDEVKAEPFVVELPDGTEKRYRGGYVPAKADPDLVDDARVQQGVREIESDMRNALPTVNNGFTKTRIENYRRPLTLDVRKIVAHLDETIRYIEVQPAIRDALRVVRHREVKGRLSRIDRSALDTMLLPWLNRVASQRNTQPLRLDWLNRFFNGLRSRAGMALMFANISNAMQQITGFFPAALRVRKGYLWSAYKEYWSGGPVAGPRAAAAKISELSPFMADRLQNQLFDLTEQINEVLLNPNRFQKLQKLAGKHGYFLQRAFQNQVDSVTWLGAYNQAIAELGGDSDTVQSEAIARADAAVRETQGSLRPEDLAAFEVSNPFIRLFTQFTGYFNMLANLNATEFVKLARDVGFRGNMGRAFSVYALGFMAPMLVADAIARTLGGRWDDEDDDGIGDELVLDWFLGGQVRGAFGLLPGGTTLNAVLGAFDDKPWNDRMLSAPAVSALEGAARGLTVLDDLVTGEISGRGIRDLATLLSLVSGLPLTQPTRYATDLLEEK